MKKPLLTMTAAATIALAGCSTGGNRMVGQRIDDRLISHKVDEALEDSPIFKYETVNVSTYAGVVQLSGWVNTEEQKNRATQIARQVQGVEDVVNNIMLKPRVTVNTEQAPDNQPNEAQGGTR